MDTPNTPSQPLSDRIPAADSRLSTNLLLLFNRLTVGWYFAAAGFGKVSGEIANGLGSFYRGAGFQDRNPSWAPEFLIAPYGFALPWLEVVFGFFLLIGLFSRLSAGVLTFLSLTISLALLGSGDLFPFHHATVFFSLTLFLFFMGPGRYGIDEMLVRRRAKVTKP